MKLKKILNYYYSIKELKPLQILFLIKNRVLKIEFKKAIIKGEFKSLNFKTTFLNTRKSLFVEDNNKKFLFINKKRLFLDWNMEEEPLWRFNLHYFDYLMQKSITKKEGLELIYSWIEYSDNNKHKKDAYHSYTTSLRVVNWIKFLNKHSIKDKKIEDSILFQLSSLFGNLEYDLMANHLLTNLLSLKFSLLFISGKHINFFTKIIDFLLKKELKEQINDDGLHYERSFMYSNIILVMILDIVNITDDEYLKNIAENMINTSYEFSIDNKIPLFNDAVNNIAFDMEDLIKYSKKLDLYVADKTNLLTLEKSNFLKLNKNDITIYFEGGGDLKYQSGHIHSSALSFELYDKKKKIFTDIGCVTYLIGDKRNYLRSTNSHNTISIDDKNQSNIWSAFRVAKRASFQAITLDKELILSSIIGYKGYKHFRNLKLKKNKLIIKDNILFKGEHKFELTFNIAPENKVEVKEKMVFINENISVFNKRLYPIIETVEYYPEFNKIVNINSIKYIGDFKDSIELVTVINLGVK